MEYGGAIYPVMKRDDRRENIFRDDEDRRRFLTTLGEACARTQWQAHAYGLMGHHLPVPSTADRFSPGAGNAPSEPGGGNEMAVGSLPQAFQSPPSVMRAPFCRALHRPEGGWIAG